MTYVPSENQSLAQLIPDEGISVEIQQEEVPAKEEVATVEEEEEEEEALVEEEEREEESCLVLEGDSDPNVLVVNSQTELIPSLPSQSPKFEILRSPSPAKEAPAEAAPAPVEAEVEREPSLDRSVSVVTETESVVTVVAAEETHDDIATPPATDPITPTVVRHTEIVADPAGTEAEAESAADEEVLQIAAMGLVNDVLQKLDSAPESDDEEE